MNREKAIDLMDLLIDQGYRVCLYGVPVDDHHQVPDYRVVIKELGVDKVDLKHLVGVAETMGLELGLHFAAMGEITFSDPDTTPQVIRNPRRHPR